MLPALVTAHHIHPLPERRIELRRIDERRDSLPDLERAALKTVFAPVTEQDAVDEERLLRSVDTDLQRVIRKDFNVSFLRSYEYIMIDHHADVHAQILEQWRLGWKEIAHCDLRCVQYCVK